MKPANKGMVRLAMEKSDQQGTPATGEGGKPPSPGISLVTAIYQESVVHGSPDPGGEFTGVLLLAVDLEKMLAERILLFTPTQEMHLRAVWVVDKDGTLLLQTEHPEMVGRDFRGRNGECNRCHVSLDHLERIMTVRDGTVEYQLKGYPKKIAAFAPMTFENASWIVVVNTPSDEVTGFIRGNFRDTLGLVGIVVVAISLASFSMHRTQRDKVSAQAEVKHLRENQGLMESLRETRDYLENLLEYANAPVIVWAPEFRITRFNRAFERLTGRSAGEVLGEPLDILFPAERREEAMTHIRRTMTGQRWETVEIPILHVDGSVRIALWNSATLYAADGTTVIATIAQGQDITERVRAEEANVRLAMAVSQSAEAIVVTDAEGTIEYVNPAFERVTGYAREEAVGRNPRILKSGKQEEEFYRQMWLALEKGEVWRGYLTNKRKDGSLYEESAVISPVRDASGRVINYVAVKRDMTDERELERRLRTVQRMEAVGTMAGGIAHDFNNALTGILGYGELLRMRLAGDPKSLADLDEISRAAERAATLTRQLLTFARRQVVEPVNLDLRDVVKDLGKFILKVIGATIEVKTFLAEDTPTVRADRGQIEQVVVNLCLNARDAMPQGGQLLVETGSVDLEEEYLRGHPYMRGGRHAFLMVSDTGTGMDEATRVRVFEPFFTTKAPDRGTGLGLSVVYGIVKQHDGSIHVYSEPGKGSTFKIYLPAIEASPDVRAPVKTEPVRGGRETILLAEDEESIRELAGRVLRDLGYRVLPARNGEEAVDVFRKHGGEISLAVLDVVMPRMGGKEAFEAMRRETPGLKAIFMSGYSANAIHESFVLRPDIPFLGKPFAPLALARKVREVLDAPG